MVRGGLLAVLLCLLSSLASADQKLQMGVFPHLSSHQLIKRYQPLVDLLSQLLGQSVVLKSARDFELFQAKLANEQYDLAIVQPLFYPDAVDRHHYQAVAQLDAPLSAITLVRHDSTFQQLSDLQGKTIATPSAMAMVSKLFEQQLQALGWQGKFSIAVTKSHDRCYQAVLSKQADACVSADRSFNGLPAWQQAQLRIINRYGHAPHILLLIHNRVAPLERQMLTDFFQQSALVQSILGGRMVDVNLEQLDSVRALLK